MNSVEYAANQLDMIFSLFNTTAADLDEAQFNREAPGTCNSIAKTHVHAATSIDFFVNRITRGGDMIWTGFAPGHGLPANPSEIWKHEAVVPLAPMRDYAKQVQASALEYVKSLSPDDLERVVDTQFFGQNSAGWVLQLVGMHTSAHIGDIAAVKGAMGLKGLPF